MMYIQFISITLQNEKLIENEKDWPNTTHKLEFSVIGAPPLLYIKQRDLRASHQNLQFSEIMNLSNSQKLP